MGLQDYESVIGLEIHAQLLTKSKAFSSDSAAYGGKPNTQVSPVSLGHPGTLPRLNRAMITCAIKMGLACNCKIRHHNEFARKNYFYADLPKGYQISQFDTPICEKGSVTIKVGDRTKEVGITRIHMEEDSGKSIHDQDPFHTLIDLNRAGVPLIEIVTEPDLRHPEEAYAFVTEIRKLVRYLDICDGNMEEGSLRCDANVSVRKKGAKAFGDKVEVKNMNSIRNVQRALEYEIKRQVETLEAGNRITQDTRSFDPATGTTFTMRSKEMAHDYRYFPEPDLPPVTLTEAEIEDIRKQMPPLPDALYEKYTRKLGLPEYDAGVLTGEKEIALFFEALCRHTDNYKAAANWVMGPVKSYLNENAVHIDAFPLKPRQLAGIIRLVDADKVSNSVAEQKLFPALLKQPNADPGEVAEAQNLVQDVDHTAIEALIEEILKEFPDKVEAYRSGKKGLMGMFMGQLMKRTKGKANPKVANKLLQEKLDQS